MCREWSFVKAADLGSGNGTHFLPERIGGRTLLLMLRWHTVLLASPQETKIKVAKRTLTPQTL